MYVPANGRYQRIIYHTPDKKPSHGSNAIKGFNGEAPSKIPRVVSPN